MNKSDDASGAIAVLCVMAIFLAAVIGWVLNIVHLCALTSGPVDAMFILRIVGIFFAPIGSVLGYV